MRSWRTGLAVCGLCLVCVLLSGSDALGQDAAAASPKPKESIFALDGNTALWSVAIRADQTQAFEQVMAKLQQALTRSQNPQRRQQAEGWTVLRLNTPLPDGTIPYVHVINPVVPGANYSIMQILYDEFPDESRALYDLYKGAFDRNLSLATGTVALDLSAPSAAPSSIAAVHTP
jgi:hypothetical protein